MSFVAYINRWDGDSPSGCRDAILIKMKSPAYIDIHLDYTFTYINSYINDKRHSTTGKVAKFKTIDEFKTILNGLDFKERTDGMWEINKSRLRIIKIEFIPYTKFKKLLPLILAEQKLKESLDKPA